MRTTILNFNETERLLKLKEFAKVLGADWQEYLDYRQNQEKFPYPGCYHLKSGGWSVNTVWQQEDGVYLSPNTYLKLNEESMYCEFRDVEGRHDLPSVLDKQILMENRYDIDSALRRIGKPEIVMDIWYDEAPNHYVYDEVEDNPGDPCSVVSVAYERVFYPVAHENNVPESFLLIERLAAAMMI